jgi:two-component system KDP operon response regulator KdpE
MLGKKILVIDDDAEICRITEHFFQKAGAEVMTAANGSEGLRKFYTLRPDLILLDIMLPDENGWETCKQIRKFSDVPIILLTALRRDEDIVRGLECGADDFISKPFSIEVLRARARAVLRRTQAENAVSHPREYEDGYLSIHLDQHRILVCGSQVKLTPTEFRLVETLFQHSGRVLTFKQILEQVWGWEYRDSVEYVHVYVSHLRQKLEEDPKHPKYLLTEHGIGYRFEAQK